MHRSAALIPCALLLLALACPAHAFIGVTKTYTGIMGEHLNITMELERQGELLAGRYKYDHVGEWLMVAGFVDENETFTLEEQDQIGQVTGSFTGQWQDTTLLGRWRSPDGSTDLPFRLETPYESLPAVMAWQYSLSAVVDPSLPELTLTITGRPGDRSTMVSVESLQVHAPNQAPPLQSIDHLHTQTPVAGESDYFGQDQPMVVEDMNFDGFLDVRIKEYASLMGNTMYLYWLYDPAAKRLVRNADMEQLSSPIFDPATRTILSVSRDQGGVFTQTFAVEDNQLIFQGDAYESFGGQ